ncbi:MAG: hypothetical protein PHI56_03245 [Victivallaceae bacterium]|nr:hypothetical protein [Victivallaceae bacterium]MDD5663247.1 hypothetical protein [Victivallaceae bacterium]
MNRSILIVICDFLVLSAMSLAIGTGRPSDHNMNIRKITKIEQIDIVRKELEKRSALLDEKKVIEAQLAAILRQLNMARRQATASKLTAEENAKMLAQLQNVLQVREKDLSTKSADLAKSSEQVGKLTNELTRAQTQLSQTSQEVVKLTGELKSTNVRVREMELGLSYTRGQLSNTEKELAEAKGKIEKMSKSLFAREIEARESQQQLENMKKLLNSAVTDLSSTKNELKSVKGELVASSSDLKSAQKYLTETETKLKVSEATLENVKTQLANTAQSRDESLASYASAVVELMIAIENERFISNAEFKNKLYLPAITFREKNYLPIDFRSATGFGSMHSGFSKVLKLDYFMNRPESSEQWRPDAFYSLNADNRMCLLENSNQSAQPLKVITYEKLKERGLKDLYLFKSNNLGKSVTILDGRCSVTIGGANKYLYVRNPRGNTELAAEIGDFIISKQGEFVGMVLAERNYDLGTRREAQCWLFTENSDINDVTPVPLGKESDDNYFTGFINASKAVIQKVNELDAEYSSGNQ